MFTTKSMCKEKKLTRHRGNVEQPDGRKVNNTTHLESQSSIPPWHGGIDYCETTVQTDIYTFRCVK